MDTNIEKKKKEKMICKIHKKFCRFFKIENKIMSIKYCDCHQKNL